jgi:hypothetical protein
MRADEISKQDWYLNTRLDFTDVNGQMDYHSLVVQIRKAYATGGPSRIRALILDALRPYVRDVPDFPVPVPAREFDPTTQWSTHAVDLLKLWVAVDQSEDREALLAKWTR